MKLKPGDLILILPNNILAPTGIGIFKEYAPPQHMVKGAICYYRGDLRSGEYVAYPQHVEGPITELTSLQKLLWDLE